MGIFLNKLQSIGKHIANAVSSTKLSSNTACIGGGKNGCSTAKTTSGKTAEFIPKEDVKRPKENIQKKQNKVNKLNEKSKNASSFKKWIYGIQTKQLNKSIEITKTDLANMVKNKYKEALKSLG